MSKCETCTIWTRTPRYYSYSYLVDEGEYVWTDTFEPFTFCPTCGTKIILSK